MNLLILKSKIHRARLTDCELHYNGSLEVDMDILEEAGILPYEKLLVVNATNGERLETYAIPGERGAKRFCLNGPAALKGNPGDIITVMVFASFTPEEAEATTPRVIVLDEKNNVIEKKGYKYI